MDVKEDMENVACKNAMIEKLRAIEMYNTWYLTKLPDSKKKMDVKWVYKLELNPNGSIAKQKARLVARGFLQKPVIDYEDVYASVSRIETIRLAQLKMLALNANGC